MTKYPDIPEGTKQDNLTILYQFEHPLLCATGRSRGRLYFCKCDCGNFFSASKHELLNHTTLSCGCIGYQRRVKAAMTHGMCKRFPSEYAAWKAANDRCYRPSVNGYKGYGGRGITVCESWRSSPLNFLADMGEKPEPKHLYSLDRIDVNGNYEPANCRWATAETQNANRRPYGTLPTFSDGEILKECQRRGWEIVCPSVPT